MVAPSVFINPEGVAGAKGPSKAMNSSEDTYVHLKDVSTAGWIHSRITVFPKHEPLPELTVVGVKEPQMTATPWGGESWAREVLRA